MALFSLKRYSKSLPRNNFGGGFKGFSIIETLLLLTLFLSIDYYFGPQNRFFNIYPHPFWIIILLITVQYSIKESLVASILCIIALLAFNWPSFAVDQDIFLFTFNVLFRPIMWIVTAIILGLLKQRQFDELTLLRAEVSACKNRENLIAKGYESMKNIKEYLEHKVASELKSVTSAYNAVEELDGLSKSEIILHAGEVISKALPVEKFSVFSLGPFGLECLYSHGWNFKENFQRRFNEKDFLFNEIVANQRLVTILNAADEQILNKEGLLAAPIIDKRNLAVIGMIKIESLPFKELTWSFIETFQVLCDWIGRSYAKAANFAEVEKKSVQDNKTSFFSFELFKWQFQIFERLSRVTSLPIQSIKIEVIAAKNKRTSILIKIGENIANKFPQNLGVFSGKDNSKEIFILFFYKSEQDAKNYKNEIFKSILDEGILQAVQVKITDEIWDLSHKKSAYLNNQEVV